MLNPERRGPCPLQPVLVVGDYTDHYDTSIGLDRSSHCQRFVWIYGHCCVGTRSCCERHSLVHPRSQSSCPAVLGRTDGRTDSTLDRTRPQCSLIIKLIKHTFTVVLSGTSTRIIKVLEVLLVRLLPPFSDQSYVLQGSYKGFMF